jgi:hypothetical protein
MTQDEFPSAVNQPATQTEPVHQKIQTEPSSAQTHTGAQNPPPQPRQRVALVRRPLFRS